MALPIPVRLLALQLLPIAVHAVAVVLAALYLTRQAWGIVSGPGFYLLLIPLLGWTLYQRFKRRRAQQQEDDPIKPPGRTRIRARRRD